MLLVSFNFSNCFVSATKICKSVHFWGARLEQGRFFSQVTFVSTSVACCLCRGEGGKVVGQYSYRENKSFQHLFFSINSLSESHRWTVVVRLTRIDAITYLLSNALAYLHAWIHRQCTYCLNRLFFMDEFFLLLRLDLLILHIEKIRKWKIASHEILFSS